MVIMMSGDGAKNMGQSPSERAVQQQAVKSKNQGLLTGLPEHFVANLFSRATTIRLKADEVLFLAGDAGDGCYRVEDGLLKVMMMSRAGSERILAFL